MFCRYCGTEVKDDAVFCPSCGKRLNNEKTASNKENFDEFKNYEYKKLTYDRVRIKKEAKDALEGNILLMFVAILIISALVGALSATFILGLVAPIFQISLFFISKKVLLKKTVDLDLIFKPLNDFNYLLKVIGASLLVAIICFLGFILFIIPGIILSLQYSQVIRIMSEDRNISISDALEKSKLMMYGHKWDLFVFELSFIGHALLVILTFGLWIIYYAPYQEIANTNFYFYLKGLENKKYTVEY